MGAPAGSPMQPEQYMQTAQQEAIQPDQNMQNQRSNDANKYGSQAQLGYQGTQDQQGTTPSQYNSQPQFNYQSMFQPQMAQGGKGASTVVPQQNQINKPINFTPVAMQSNQGMVQAPIAAEQQAPVDSYKYYEDKGTSS